MKKLLLCLCVLFMLCGCGQKESSVKYSVGIIQLLRHDALDAATRGFIDELNNEFGEEIFIGEPLIAAGESSTCGLMASNLIAEGVDLIMANATPAVVACKTATDKIPVLGTSVTDYASALNLDNFNGTIGNNVTGTSDLAPLDVQAKMFLELLPDVKKVGILYCTNESNSIYQFNEVGKVLKEIGIEVVEIAFAEANDLGSVLSSKVAEIDALYIPTDNVCASSGGIIRPLTENIPVIAGEKECCKNNGGLATLSIDYYGLGVITGQMAGKILRGEAKPEEMKIETYPNPEKLINMEKAKQFNIVVPEDYKAMD